MDKPTPVQVNNTLSSIIWLASKLQQKMSGVDMENYKLLQQADSLLDDALDDVEHPFQSTKTTNDLQS